MSFSIPSFSHDRVSSYTENISNEFGKKTLCKLIAHFFELFSGSIFIDGQNIYEIDVESFRLSVTYQLQDQYLISGSLLDNIVYGDEDIDMNRVKSAVSKAQIADFINTAGRITYIGEIIRWTSAKNCDCQMTKIAILDEPTAFIQ
ncbi:putative ABC transporter ATP-binding protein [compost metagenome]